MGTPRQRNRPATQWYRGDRRRAYAAQETHDRYIRVRGLSVFISWSGRGSVSSRARDPRYSEIEYMDDELKHRLSEARDEAGWRVAMQTLEDQLIARLRKIR